MFKKICIESKKSTNQKIDIAFLVDTMFFYENVVVLVRSGELTTILEFFGEDILKELIKTGRLDIRVQENIFGSATLPNNRYTIDLWSVKDEDYSAIIYKAHRKLVNNSSKNLKFTDELSKITQPFRYTEDITDQIKEDFVNVGLLTRMLTLYIQEIIPDFELPADLQIEIIKEAPSGPFEAYSLKSNFDVEKFNQISKKVNKEMHYDFDYSAFLLALSESKGNMYISSHFESELVTTKLYSDFISQQFQDMIHRRLNSQNNIELFKEYVLSDYHTIGDAFVKGVVSPRELINFFEKANKFKDWLSKVPEDRNLIGEYHRAVTATTFADKLPTKVARFMLLEGIGLAFDFIGAGGVGTVLATGLGAFDTFYLDKILSGWKPNHFIENSLKPLKKANNS